MVFNPTLESSVRFEQPVERPSGLQALVNLGGIFLDAASNKPQPRELTQSERDNLALQPFANRMADLANAVPVGRRASISRQAQAEFTAFARENPGLAPEASGLMRDILGIEVTPVETDPNSALIAARNEFAATPEGQIAYVSSVVTKPDGQVDLEATAVNFEAAFMQRQAEEARIAQTNRRLSQSQGNVNLWKSESEAAMADFLPAWQQESAKCVDNLVGLVVTGDERFDEWGEALSFLRERERVIKDSFRSRALAAGMHPEVYEARVNDATAPIRNLITVMEENMTDQGKILDALKNSAEHGSVTAMLEVFGEIAGLPEFRNEAARQMASDRVFTEGAWTRIQEYYKTASRTNSSSPLDLFSSIPTTTQEALAGSIQLSNPDVVAGLREQGQEKIFEHTETAGEAIDTIGIEKLSDPKVQQAVLGHIGMIVNSADALDNPLSVKELERIFRPNGVRVLAAISNSSPDARNALISFTTTQIRRNQSQINSSLAGLPEGVNVSYNSGRAVLSVDVEQFLGTEEGLRFEDYVSQLEGKTVQSLTQEELLRSMSNFSRAWGQKISAIQDNAASYNFLVGTGRHISPEFTTEVPTRLEQDTGVSQPGLRPILALLDRTEGGGNYDTLFGHSQRPGGQFAGVKITEMTLGELREFANVRGAYGQWVKGQVGRVATPMGRYQFVGTTLFALADKLGIPDTAVFTPELQDALFAYHARVTLSRRNTIEGKRAAMRAEWEGFKHVSDAELDAAIRAFETGEPLDFSSVIVRETDAAPSGVTPQALPSVAPFEPPSVTLEKQSGGFQLAVSPGPEQAIQPAPVLSEDQAQIVAYLTAVSKGQLTSEGQEILRALGINPDDENVKRAIEQFDSPHRKIAQHNRRQLIRMGVDPESVPVYNSLEEAERDMNAGKLKENSAFILPDGSLHFVEGDD